MVRPHHRKMRNEQFKVDDQFPIFFLDGIYLPNILFPAGKKSPFLDRTWLGILGEIFFPVEVIHLELMLVLM